MVPQWMVRVLLVAVIVSASLTLGGCAVIGGIFKAGMWVGALAVVFVVLIVGFIIAKVSG